MHLCQCGCGKEVTKESNKFINGHNALGLKRDPSIALKRKRTCMNRYGVESITQLSDMKEKSKKTCIEKYGVEYAVQSKKVKEKIEKTCLKKYGVKSHNQTESVKEKKKKTCLINFGVENPNQSEEIKEKKKQTCLKNFGVEYPGQSEEVKKKSKISCLEKFGVENPSQSDEIKEKKKQTSLNNLGTIHNSRSREIKEKKKQTCIEHFGVDNWAKTEQGRTKSRINYIRMIENQKLNGEPLSPRVGDKERLCLNELQLYTSFNIERQYPSFKYEIGRIPDGYIKELNLVVLFHERNHYLNDNYIEETEDTVRTTKDYISLGLNVFKISEKQWKDNKEQIINDFINLIGVEYAKQKTCNE